MYTHSTVAPLTYAYTMLVALHPRMPNAHVRHSRCITLAGCKGTLTQQYIHASTFMPRSYSRSSSWYIHAALLLYLMMAKYGPISPLPVPQKRYVILALSSDSGAVARAASSGTYCFFGAAPKQTPVSSAEITSAGVYLPAQRNVWISDISLFTSSGDGRTFCEAVTRRRRSATRLSQPRVHGFENLSLLTSGFSFHLGSSATCDAASLIAA
mmetsp:Transcript_34091/g.113793  ORF Transcript_34091/g.113793 Transcript_34091/m.113793 type:complete len:212 (+) Transcript_34091:94-729(+)